MYLAAGVIGRANGADFSEAESTTHTLNQEIRMANWNTEGILLGVCEQWLPESQPGSVVGLCNQTGTAKAFEEVLAAFNNRYKTKSEVVRFTKIRPKIEDEDFKSAEETCRKIIDDYEVQKDIGKRDYNEEQIEGFRLTPAP